MEENRPVDPVRGWQSINKTGFRASGDRLVWVLVAAAAVAAAVWAVAQVLEWPTAVQAPLAASAATVAVLVPELKARWARRQGRKDLLGMLDVPPTKSGLPHVADIEPGDLRVHEALVETPYIKRDVSAEIDPALLSGIPVLLIGHSMCGKTRLAVAAIQQNFSDSALVVPPSSAVLRQLLQKGLQFRDVVVLLDDLERFLKGEGPLDVALIRTLRDSGARIMATMRLNEFARFRPTDEAHPPQWEVLGLFRRISLARRPSPNEMRLARAMIRDRATLEGIERYGLAEYFGGGPLALKCFEDGETECPVGWALVRTAIDWRRTGMIEAVDRTVLQEFSPEYLRDRPDVTLNSVAFKHGMDWATARINETVALLSPYRGSERRGRPIDAGYEAFDYIVDVVSDQGLEIPSEVWRRSVGPDVLLAGRAYIGRRALQGDLLSWLTDKSLERPALAVIAGPPGSGKTALLHWLRQFSQPEAHPGLASPSELDRVIPPVTVIDARDLTTGRPPDSGHLLAELFSAVGDEDQARRLAADSLTTGGVDMGMARSQYLSLSRLVHAIVGLKYPFVVAVDSVDYLDRYENSVVTMLLDLARMAQGVAPLRLLLAASDPHALSGDALIFNLTSPEYAIDLEEFIRVIVLTNPRLAWVNPADLASLVHEVMSEQITSEPAGSFARAAALIRELEAKSDDP